MMSENATLSNIVFVLDRPRELANIGAVIRLLGNFGFNHLRIVEPSAFDRDRVLRYARRGAEVAAAIRCFDNLEAAIADCALVLGATRRPRALERPVLNPREAAGQLLAYAGTHSESDEFSTSDGLTVPTAPAAVLFGPEDFGLANEAVDRCNAIITIPTSTDDQSLNLSHAAVIVAYEIHLAFSAADYAQSISDTAVSQSPRLVDLAPSAELEELFEALRHMLEVLHDPLIEGRTRASLQRMRALMLRANPRVDEVRRLTEMYQHIAQRLRQ